jgi:hypothetical protein
MIRNRAQRRFLLIAAIAIGVALLLMLLPHSHVVSDVPFLFLLPIVFLGLLPSPCEFARIDSMRLEYTPEDHALPASFQRPPPCRLA